MQRQLRKIGRRYFSARGTVMSEMVLVLPFLLLFVAYVFYFGRGMVRVQRSQAVDRYEVWRQVGNGFGPKYTEPAGMPHGPQLNDAFFAENATSVSDFENIRNYFPDDAPQELIQQVSSFSFDAGELADEAYEAFPKGRSIGFTSSHEERVPIWKPFNGPMRHRHTRLDNEWKFVNGWTEQGPQGEPSGGGPFIMPEMRDVFFEDFDSRMEGFENGGNNIAQRIRWIYLSKPGYRGPTVE